ncbi:LamG domain-containing protein, partial [Candidatus Woesearchaeota archaeon]|nr:LamG domain-containing protein [Candidatus Woesearchaeota archaeon]
LKGWTFSTWVKFDAPQSAARILAAEDSGHRLELIVNGQNLNARWQENTAQAETPAVPLTPGAWHQLTLVVRDTALTLYVDGNPAGNAKISLTAFTPRISLGEHWSGWLDEVGVATTARSADWIKLGYRSQMPDFAVLGFGQDEAGGESSGGHFSVIVENVTVDGWQDSRVPGPCPDPCKPALFS